MKKPRRARSRRGWNRVAVVGARGGGTNRAV